MLSKIKNKNIIALLSLFVGTALTAIATLFTTIILAKYTTTEVFGNYSSILVTITTLTPLAGFGIAQYWLKLFGQHGSYGILWIKKSLIFISISTAFVFILLHIWFFLTLNSSYLIFVSTLLSFIIFKFVSTEIINSVLQIEEKYLFLAFWQFFQSSFVLIIVLIIVYFFTTSLNELQIAIIQLSTVFLSIFMSIYIFYKFLKNQKKKINLKKIIQLKKEKNPHIIKIFKESAPFGLAGLFSLIYSQLGVVFVRYIEGPEAAAQYTVAFTFLLAALLIPLVIYQKFLLPKLHRWAYHDKDKFEKSFYYGSVIMFFLGILVFLFLWFFSPYFINLFFGEKYQASIFLLKIMAINIPIVYVASSAGSLLVTQNHMMIKVYYMGASAIIYLILCAPSINYFGTIGAIYTNIICNIFIIIIYFYKVKKDILSRTKKGSLL